MRRSGNWSPATRTSCTGWCCGWRADRSQVDDLAQDVFLKIHRGLPYFRGEARLSTWIYRIVMNVCVQARSRPRGKCRSTAVRIGRRSIRARPTRRSRDLELRDRLDKAIAQLPEHYRFLIAAHHLSGMQYEALAEALDIPLGTVKTHLHRAKRRCESCCRNDTVETSEDRIESGRGGRRAGGRRVSRARRDVRRAAPPRWRARGASRRRWRRARCPRPRPGLPPPSPRGSGASTGDRSSRSTGCSTSRSRPRVIAIAGGTLALVNLSAVSTAIGSGLAALAARWRPSRSPRLARPPATLDLSARRRLPGDRTPRLVLGGDGRQLSIDRLQTGRLKTDGLSTVDWRASSNRQSSVRESAVCTSAICSRRSVGPAPASRTGSRRGGGPG